MAEKNSVHFNFTAVYTTFKRYTENFALLLSQSLIKRRFFKRKRLILK